jgi:ComF family protein
MTIRGSTIGDLADRAMHGSSAGLRALLGAAVDAVLPRQCLSCRTEISGPGGLCGDCWSGLNFIAAPYCACCGYPFGHDIGADALCAACAAARPAFSRARAALVYDEHSRPPLLAFKHGDRLAGTDAFAGWLIRAGAELLEGADLLAPVPLHRWRLLRRRYNQAALLGAAVARCAGIAHGPDLLVRVRATPSQGGLGRLGRVRNVTGAFRVHPRHAASVRGKNVVVIDDVLTTGATASACARALQRSGASRVDVLTLARVVRPADPAI